jgi:predicted DNA-binding transcriptional regulator AlpA
MRMLTFAELKDRGVPHSRTQVWRWIQAGTFPKPVRLGKRICWPVHEVDEWLRARIAARDAEASAA